MHGTVLRSTRTPSCRGLSLCKVDLLPTVVINPFSQGRTTLPRCSMAPIDNVKANCLCGSVVVQTTGRPFNSFLCHCSICQRMTGTDFEHALAWDWDKVELVKGHDIVKSYQSSGHVPRKFCGRCSSAVFAEEKLAGEIPCKVVLAGCLEHGPDGRAVCWDDPSLEPQHHIFYDTHILDFSGDGIPKWEGFPHKSKRIDDVAYGQYSRM